MRNPRILMQWLWLSLSKMVQISLKIKSKKRIKMRICQTTRMFLVITKITSKKTGKCVHKMTKLRRAKIYSKSLNNSFSALMNKMETSRMSHTCSDLLKLSKCILTLCTSQFRFWTERKSKLIFPNTKRRSNSSMRKSWGGTKSFSKVGRRRK